MRFSKGLSDFKQKVAASNPISKRFMMWYGIAILVGIMAVVSIRVIPRLLEDRRLNAEILSGKVYQNGTDSILKPEVADFILLDDESFHLDPYHRSREILDRWEPQEIQKYWDTVDQQKLKELNQTNRTLLERQLDALP